MYATSHPQTSTTPDTTLQNFEIEFGMKADMTRTIEPINLLALKKKNNTLWKTFKKNLLQSINTFIPHKVVKPRDSPPWISNEMKKLIKRGNRLYLKKKKSNHSSRIKLFKILS